MYVYTDCFRLSVLSDSDCRHEGLGSGREQGAFRYFMSEVDGRSSLAFRVERNNWRSTSGCSVHIAKGPKIRTFIFWRFMFFLVQFGNRVMRERWHFWKLKVQPLTHQNLPTSRKSRVNAPFPQWFHGFFLEPPGRWPNLLRYVRDVAIFRSFFSFFPQKRCIYTRKAKILSPQMHTNASISEQWPDERQAWKAGNQNFTNSTIHLCFERSPSIQHFSNLFAFGAVSSGHCGKPGRRNPSFSASCQNNVKHNLNALFGMDNYPFWCFISSWIILESSGVICGFPWHFNRLGHVLPSFGKRSISVCLGWVAVLKAVKAVENSWQTRKNSIDLTGDLIVSMKKRLLKGW